MQIATATPGVSAYGPQSALARTKAQAEPANTLARTNPQAEPANARARANGQTEPTKAQEQAPEEARELAQLKQRDREVRAHEQAHLAAAGGLARGGASYQMTRGSDGRSYATGGEVQIDSSPVADDPKATIAKAQQIRRAALAPANPSSQDRQVAASASAMAAEARAELASAPPDADGSTADGSTSEPSDASAATNGAPDAVCEQCGGKHSGGAHAAFNQREIDRTLVQAQPEAPTLDVIA